MALLLRLSLKFWWSNKWYQYVIAKNCIYERLWYPRGSMQFCGDLHLFILPHWYVGVEIVLRTAHTTINHTPHGSINYGRPPRRSIVVLSRSANSYLLLLGVTIFIFRLATIYAWFFQSPPEFTTEPLLTSVWPDFANSIYKPKADQHPLGRGRPCCIVR